MKKLRFLFAFSNNIPIFAEAKTIIVFDTD